jgi:hypothetical protein
VYSSPNQEGFNMNTGHSRTISRRALAGLSVLAAVLAVFVGLSVPGSAVAEGPPQLDEEAALVIEGPPSAGPCAVSLLIVDVLDFVIPDQPDQMYYQLLSTCPDGEHSFSPPPSSDPFLIGESAFELSGGHDVGDLVVTLPTFDYLTGTEALITFDLTWASSPGVSDGSASVTGTVSAGETVAVLDDSIVWNRWGSELGFPWAGMWPCHFAGRSPGCIGQA